MGCAVAARSATESRLSSCAENRLLYSWPCEILLEARDWEPKTDLQFSYFAEPGALIMAAYGLVESEASKALPIAQRCPNVLDMWQVGLARAEPNPGDDIAPSDPTDEDVERFAKEGLGNAELCRGFVYAMYGKRFEDDARNRYFFGPEGRTRRRRPPVL